MSPNDFRKWTAADLMERDAIVVNPGDSLQEAMKLMIENHVSGLPVLDSKDRCVGVISASDILSFESDQAELEEAAGREEIPYFDPDSGRWETIAGSRGIDELPALPVSEVMTRDLVSVAPSASVAEVARIMLDAGVHRIVVVDEEKMLHGIISAIDFVRIAAQSD